MINICTSVDHRTTMEQKHTVTLFEKALPVLRRRWVYHSLFWLVVVLLFTIFEMLLMGLGFFQALSNNAVRLLILGAGVYYNVYVLVPQYLARKRLFVYLGMVVLLTLIITPIESFLLFVKSTRSPELQAGILRELHLAFIPNFFLLLTSTVVKIVGDWYRHMRDRQVLATEQMQSELRFLKSQINPHFLFNTLNNLYALTLKKDDKAPDIVLKLSEMMRYMLYECNEKQVLLAKEVSYIHNYLELERLRQGRNVEIRFDVKGHIGDQRIAPLLFIPFVENCFKHGLGQHIEKGFVHIALQLDGQHVEFFVENSKAPALPRQRHPRSGGIGLANVRRRLDLLYPGAYSLDIHDNPDTYTVRLKIDLQAHQTEAESFTESFSP